MARAPVPLSSAGWNSTTSSPGETNAVSAVKSASVAPVVIAISVAGSNRRPYKRSIFIASASRRAGAPGIGAYWLAPAHM